VPPAWIARAKGFSLAGSDSRRSPEWGRLILVPRSAISQPRALTAFSWLRRRSVGTFGPTVPVEQRRIVVLKEIRQRAHEHRQGLARMAESAKQAPRSGQST
jgi:hypothetical protein